MPAERIDSIAIESSGYYAGWRLRESMATDELNALVNQLRTKPEILNAFLRGVERANDARGSEPDEGFGNVSQAGSPAQYMD